MDNLSKLDQIIILYHFFIFRNFLNARIPKNTAKNAAVAPTIAITTTIGSTDVTDAVLSRDAGIIDTCCP